MLVDLLNGKRMDHEESPGSKAKKQVLLQIMNFAIKAAG